MLLYLKLLKNILIKIKINFMLIFILKKFINNCNVLRILERVEDFFFFVIII